MRARGWSNGTPTPSGAGYGLVISPGDRDRYFDRAWNQVTLVIDGREITVPVTPSFWRSCTELRSRGIGAWMLEASLAPWPRGRPPVVDLEPMGEAHFEVRPARP